MKWIAAFLVMVQSVVMAQNVPPVIEPQPDQLRGYTATVDLTNVQGDGLYVSLEVPAVFTDEAEYHMPKIVPGTYSISDFGRFISEFKAFDHEGHELKTEPIDTNRWKIIGAKKLKKVTYWVEDTYDTDKKNVIFEPAGTNIEKGKNFIINTFGFFGYIDGKKNLDYNLRIHKPEGFYGASTLDKHMENDGKTDVWSCKNYNTLADCPIMYSIPDTASLTVGGALVEVAVYSTKDKITAAWIMEEVKPILEASKDYLGGKLPCEKYAFLFYFVNGPTLSGGMGALEHMTSSLYVLPEMNPLFLRQTIKDVAAHEFFHIVTPLNIHSEEIGDFNFVEPEMSQHLWMYEGVTEYSAHHVQVTSGLMKPNRFIETMRGKMKQASRYNDTVPFTHMSEFVLEDYEPEYGNVYQKGALIAMCVDIKLRSLTDGAYGLPDLMQDLAKEYGADVSFKDEELFDKIAELSKPEMKDFLNKYVAGPEPLPYEEILALVGLNYRAKIDQYILSDGGVEWLLNRETGRMQVVAVDKINSFGANIGLKIGDELISLAGMEVNAQNFAHVLEVLGKKYQKSKNIKVKFARTMPDGTEKVIDAKVKSKASRVKEKYYIQRNFNATDQQIKIYEAWLNRTW